MRQQGEKTWKHEDNWERKSIPRPDAPRKKNSHREGHKEWREAHCNNAGNQETQMRDLEMSIVLKHLKVLKH